MIAYKALSTPSVIRKRQKQGTIRLLKSSLFMCHVKHKFLYLTADISVDIPIIFYCCRQTPNHIEMIIYYKHHIYLFVVRMFHRSDVRAIIICCRLLIGSCGTKQRQSTRLSLTSFSKNHRMVKYDREWSRMVKNGQG